MASKRGLLVKCPPTEYWDALHERIIDPLSCEEDIFSVYFRLRNSGETVMGAASLSAAMGSSSVALTLMNPDFVPSDKTMPGQISRGFWNPRKGSSISFTVRREQLVAYNGVFRPYVGRIALEEFLQEQEPTMPAIDPMIDMLPPSFFL